LRLDYNRLKGDINNLEAILDDMIAKVMSCIIKRYDTDGYKRQIEKLRTRLYYLEMGLERIKKDIENVVKKRKELNEKLEDNNMNRDIKEADLESKKNRRKETR